MSTRATSIEAALVALMAAIQAPDAFEHEDGKLVENPRITAALRAGHRAIRLSADEPAQVSEHPRPEVSAPPTADLDTARAERDEARAALVVLRDASMALYREAYGPSRAIREVTALCDQLGAALEGTASLAAMAPALDAARAEERERCARVCEAYAGDGETIASVRLRDAADAIRAGNPPEKPDGSRDVVADIVADLRRAAVDELGPERRAFCAEVADRIEAAHGKVTR